MKARQAEQNSPQPLTTRLLTFIACAYGLALSLTLAVWLLAGERFWPVALAVVFLFWLMLPTLILLPLAILLRAPLAIGANLPGLLALLILYGWCIFPQPVARAAEGQPLRVMSFNTAADMASAEQVIEAVQAADPDIVVLLELGDETAPTIEAGLAAGYPYRALYGRDIQGKGLLSRYPILEAGEPFHLSTPQTHMLATIGIEGQPVRLVIAHPPPPGFTPDGYGYLAGSWQDLRYVIDAASQGGPTLLLGDFNANDLSERYRAVIDSGLRDAYREAGVGPGFTYPERRWFYGYDFIPLVRIDYIFYSAQFEALNAWVGPDAGSDHRPLIADLLLELSQ